MDTSTTGDLEVVLLVRNQRADLDDAVGRVIGWLSAHAPSSWTVTIADQGSSDGTAAAEHLALRTPEVRVVELGERFDRQALRSHWQTSTSAIVAFVDLDADGDLDELLAPLAAIPSTPPPERSSLLSRRAALMTLGGAGLALVLAACGRSSTSNATAATAATAAPGSAGTSGSTATTTAPSSTSSSSSSSSGAVPLAVEMTDGPYYLDLNLVRRNITEDRAGAPFTLDLVVATTAGAPIAGTAVDIWHCDANGLYSGFVSSSAGANRGSTATADDGTFLRGTQITDAAGKVTFQTIYPGWYAGRTVHIHVKVHVSGKVVHTGQLFFDDSFTDAVFAGTAPYSSRGARDTRNARDGIYNGGGSASVLDVKKSGAAYAATITMGVKSA